MKEEKAKEIFGKIMKVWIKRHGKDKLNPIIINSIRDMLKVIPDEDGCKRVINAGTGKTHLVPIEDIILDGLKGNELYKYPIENEKEKEV